MGWLTIQQDGAQEALTDLHVGWQSAQVAAVICARGTTAVNGAVLDC